MRRASFRAKLEAAGFESQAAFAGFLKVDVGTVSRWARGYVEVPHPIRLLLDALIANRRRRKELSL
jgi:DNA-binding transcriptional regulator YiaG